ncbi:hypothetical protein M407DRAFT_164987 [Tulasnella calospora MUT 4182]|uniref:Uncharacterized protein n=1 Tax=Tulasnella calospora MUT 4182 TaxID=1051891 RepID=A0A0C3PT17_9AGAM|nr:hypothetical protein M407DRAFT_164987 [Tulasnella calospora MUT 4182]
MRAHSKSLSTTLWKLSEGQMSTHSGKIRIIPTIETGRCSIYSDNSLNTNIELLRRYEYLHTR